MDIKKINIEKIKSELLEKEVTLLELDNYIQQEIETTQSLFDDEYYVLQDKSASYYLNDDNDLIIGFEIVEKNENSLYTIIKIDEIFIYQSLILTSKKNTNERRKTYEKIL